MAMFTIQDKAMEVKRHGNLGSKLPEVDRTKGRIVLV